MPRHLLAALILVVGCASAPDSRTGVDTLYFGGEILTMDGPAPVYAEAVAVEAGRIAYVGSRTGANQLVDDDTELVDLQSAAMLPGFIDPHGHFMSALRMVEQVNLASPPMGEVTKIDDIVAKLEAFRKEREVPAGGWLVGWGYDQDLLAERRHVTKLDLDPHFPDHKVLVIHISMHGAVLNSAALEWAGLDASSPTPEGGIIARLEGSQEPAGLLMETAFLPVFAKMPQPSVEEMLEKYMEPAQMMYASQGYTQAVEGFSHISDLDLLARAADEGRFFIDIASLPGFVDMEEWLDNPKYEFGRARNHYKIQAGKFTLDGSPQGKTAFISTPYKTGGPAGQKDWRGQTSIPREDFFRMVKKLTTRGIPIHIHANGDAAIDESIEAVRQAGITAGDDRRPIMIHSQFQTPEHLRSYVELGISPSYFTNHTFYWGDVHVENIGREMAFFISPVKSATDLGLVYANHTDFNVTLLDPFFVMWSAMARESRSGVVIGPDERVDAYTALQGLTTGPAWQFFEEDRKGRLKKGLLADFVILSADPCQTELADLRKIKVLETIKEGRSIYRAPE